MTRLCTTIAAGLALSVAASNALAQRTRLDDSASPRQTYSVELAWNASEITAALHAFLAGAPESMPRATGRIANVDVRLDTRGFVGSPARIYLTLPAPSSGLGGVLDLELRWEAGSRFFAGAVRPGQSTLVFEGLIDEPVMTAIFDFVLALESGAAVATDVFVLEPIYEIEPLL